MMPSIPQLLIVLALVIPPLHVLLSRKRSHGGAKFGWFLVTMVFSWLGYIVYLIMTQKHKDAQH